MTVLPLYGPLVGASNPNKALRNFRSERGWGSSRPKAFQTGLNGWIVHVGLRLAFKLPEQMLEAVSFD